MFLQKMMLCAAMACLLLAAAPVSARAAAGSPLEALELAQQAIENADYSLFSKVVDIDAIIQGGAADVLKAVRDEAKAGRLGKENDALGALLGALNLDNKDQMAMLTQMVASDARAMVASGISGGYFAGKPNGKTKFKGVTGLLAGVSAEAKRIIPGELLSRKENAAVVSAVLEDAGAGSFPLELDMKQQNENWRVTGVHNVGSLVKKAIKRAQ